MKRNFKIIIDPKNDFYITKMKDVIIGINPESSQRTFCEFYHNWEIKRECGLFFEGIKND
ncbi:hypothetical protein COD22_06285 [Bacillus thuringiensis]|nr:hypothetical protein COD22_06285 [Bacillus thuringiensis]